jgi:hypothetical protein
MTRHTIVQLLVMASAATTFFFLGHRTAAIVLSVLLAVTLVLALIAPSALATFQELLRRGGVRVATAVGVVLLTLVYFLVFVPGAIWLRLLRIDKLNRSFPGDRASNWINRVGYGADNGLYSKPYTRPHAFDRAGGSGK